MRSHQNQSTLLARSQDAFETRRLNGVFLGTMKHLPCRPEPRHHFDDFARTEPRQRRQHPGQDAVSDCRTILRAAVATGDARIVNATRREIEHYFEAMKASALREVVPDDAASIDDAIIGFHRESCEALTAVTTAGVQRTEGALETAVRELREADDAGEQLLEQLEASIRIGRREMAVIR